MLSEDNENIYYESHIVQEAENYETYRYSRHSCFVVIG
jgi:hypothetical protein